MPGTVLGPEDTNPEPGHGNGDKQNIPRINIIH